MECNLFAARSSRNGTGEKRQEAVTTFFASLRNSSSNDWKKEVVTMSRSRPVEAFPHTNVYTSGSEMEKDISCINRGRQKDREGGRKIKERVTGWKESSVVERERRDKQWRDEREVQTTGNREMREKYKRQAIER